MPAHNRFRLYNVQGVEGLNADPVVRHEDPAILWREWHSFRISLQDGDLVALQDDLCLERRPKAKKVPLDEGEQLDHA